MDLTRTHAGFDHTSHTLIEALSDHRTSKAAADELARVYWPPVYSFLRKSGYGREHAAELTQSFFVEKVTNGKLMERYDSTRGRLRSLILKALKNYIIDVHRKVQSMNSAAQRTFMMTPEEERWGDETTPTAAFDRRWAISQLGESLVRCEEYFIDSARVNHWKVFEARVLHPAIHQADPLPLKDLADQYGFQNSALVSAAVQLVKRRLIIFLREVISDSLTSPEHLDEELDQAIHLLKSL